MRPTVDTKVQHHFTSMPQRFEPSTRHRKGPVARLPSDNVWPRCLAPSSPPSHRAERWKTAWRARACSAVGCGSGRFLFSA